MSPFAEWVRPDDWRMAWRNVVRQRARTLLTLAVLVTGVAGLILSGGFVEDALRTLRESTIHAQVGHLQVSRAGFTDFGRRAPHDYLIDDPRALRASIAALPQVTNVMARLNFSAVLNNGKNDIAVIGEGIEPAPEARLGTQMQLIGGRALAEADRFGIMLGEGLAASAGVKAGSVVNLLVHTREGALNNLEFTVTGVFRTFSKDYDARAARIALSDAQDLLAAPAVNTIVVELDRTESTAEANAALHERLDGRAFEIRQWNELADFYEKTAALFKRQFAFLQAIILLMVILAVANSVNMTVFERTGEFGTLMSLGRRRSDVFRLVILENCVLGLVGSIAGLAFGILVASLINLLQVEMPPPPNSNSGYYAGIRLTIVPLVTSLFVGFLATPITALWPAFRISRVPVHAALRAN